MRTSLTIRLIRPLPLYIDGGKTQWKIFVAYGGKNDSKGEILAYCEKTKTQITILTGRARYIEGAVRKELYASEGTMLWRIFRKCVQLGYAEVVSVRRS